VRHAKAYTVSNGALYKRSTPSIRNLLKEKSIDIKKSLNSVVYVERKNNSSERISMLD
jgi:hypothetical protein